MSMAALMIGVGVLAFGGGCGSIDDPTVSSGASVHPTESTSAALSDDSSGSGSQNTCKTSAECPHPLICELCKEGHGPACAAGDCFQGHCTTIAPCSGTPCKTAAECPHPDICALCTRNLGPSCATSQCVNGWCHEIGPCSIEQ
jgi:hypothetical protein